MAALKIQFLERWETVAKKKKKLLNEFHFKLRLNGREKRTIAKIVEYNSLWENLNESGNQNKNKSRTLMTHDEWDNK